MLYHTSILGKGANKHERRGKFKRNKVRGFKSPAPRRTHCVLVYEGGK